MCDSKKICTKCFLEKDISSFNFSPSKHRYLPHCKECIALYNKSKYNSKRDTIYVDDKKKCNKCGEFKGFCDFYYLKENTKRGGSNYSSSCKICNNKKSITTRFKEFSKRTNLNITLEEFVQRYNKQNFICEICGEKEEDTKGTRLAIDHDHVTGKFRGFICNRCNSGIGFLRDNITILNNAKKYLEKFKNQCI